MQSLFALEQCNEATYELCFEKIKEKFSPNLNSMEVQPKELLASQRKETAEVFKKIFKNNWEPMEHEDSAILSFLLELKSYYMVQTKKDAQFLRKSLIKETEEIYGFYLDILTLLMAFKEVAEADKKVNHRNLIENPWIFNQVPVVYLFISLCNFLKGH